MHGCFQFLGVVVGTVLIDTSKLKLKCYDTVEFFPKKKNNNVCGLSSLVDVEMVAFGVLLTVHVSCYRFSSMGSLTSIFY